MAAIELRYMYIIMGCEIRALTSFSAIVVTQITVTDGLSKSGHHQPSNVRDVSLRRTRMLNYTISHANRVAYARYATMPHNTAVLR
jgi:hypothetical protein